MSLASQSQKETNEKARAQRPVFWWLVAMCVLVFLMVMVGGLTRLTDSGLSITEWKPVTGALPPLSLEAWQAEFLKYQQIPEYRLINEGMSLDDFKRIYWWEWGHRLLGRLIGVAFFLPFVWFAWRGLIDRRLGMKLGVIFILGGLQGFAGWYMVQSGLTHRVDVSQYRLALHLGLAILIYGAMAWVALGLRWPDAASGRLSRVGLGLLGLVFVQIVLGAFVAGLDAGLAYNTWPLMDGRLVPAQMFVLDPWWLNFLENPKVVQFTHRMVAYLLLIAVGVNWIWRRSRSALWLLIAVLAQAGLGIWTLLAHVPLTLGAAHQLVAVLAFTAAIYHGWDRQPTPHRS